MKTGIPAHGESSVPLPGVLRYLCFYINCLGGDSRRFKILPRDFPSRDRIPQTHVAPMAHTTSHGQTVATVRETSCFPWFCCHFGLLLWFGRVVFYQSKKRQQDCNREWLPIRFRFVSQVVYAKRT